MVFKRLRVQNFKAITGPHQIPLAELGVVHVVGENRLSRAADSNGAAKTALVVSAPCWCLTGRTEDRRRVVAGAAIRNRHARGPAVVEMEIEDDRGDAYALRRERGEHGSDSVKLVGPHGRVWDAKHEIERFLGFDWQFFTNVVVFGPDTSARFSQAPDSERKAIFDQIIPDLDRLARVHERADALAKNLAAQAELLGANLAAQMARLEEIRRAEAAMAEQAAGAEAAKRGAMDALSGQRARIYEAIAERIARDARLEALRPRAEEFATVARRLRTAEIKMVSLAARTRDLEANLRSHEEEARRLVAGGKCPTCFRKFDPGSRKAIVAQAMRRDDPVRAELVAERANHDNAVAAHASLAAQFLAHEPLAKELAADRGREEWEALKSELAHVDRRIHELDRAIAAGASPVVSRLAEVERGVGELEAEARLAAEEGEIVDFWVEALGARGIKSRLLDGVEEYLDSRLRRYSSALTAGEVTIGFSSRTRLKGGGQKDAICVSAEHVFGAAELDLHSSGERQRVDLAIVLALQDLARQRRGTALRLSLFDEVFDHLDETGVERLMGLLQDEKRERGTIAVVTQNPRISSQPADHQIVVRRERGGTTVLFDDEEV